MEIETIVKPTLVLTEAEKKLKRFEYGKQWRATNMEKIKTYRKENSQKLAAFQRKYDNAKRNDPAYRELHKARQKRCIDKKKEAKKTLEIEH